MGRTLLSTLSFLLYCLSITANAASDGGSRPAGVGPEFAKYYKDPSTFTCISAPSIVLDISRLNDDYCDCPDGSDEPGTSACSHLSPLSPPQPFPYGSPSDNSTPALPGFYCKNKGHQPSYIPFTYVNDGICDYELCCDGSDEQSSISGTKCEDRCAKIGKEWRKAEEARQKSLGVANKKRRELVAEAGRLKREVEDRIQTLRTQIQGAEMKVAALEKNVAEIEREEKGKIVRGPAGGQGGKLAVLTQLAKDRITELVQNLGRVRGERDEARKTVQELEEILRKFKEEYNPNFNDEGVKRAVKAWEDYAAQEKPGPDAAHDRDLDEMLKSDAENGINWEEYENHEESDVEVLYKFEAYLPPPLRTWLDSKLRSLRILLIENGILADPHTSDTPESKRVTDARQQLTTAQSELETDRSELTRHEEDAVKDYGPSDVFRALQNTCINQDSGEYTYELCFMTSTTQKSKTGHGNTGMGNFVRLETIETDEDVPADGKGVGRGKRWVMKFENGQHCWNGPSRSTMVVLACAERDEIWKVAEEEKCVYRMEVGSPSVCGGSWRGGGRGDRCIMSCRTVS
ncbi:glucosidase II beta subunit-like protein-domain-containing protein [Clohesyomyces aquaticus]|uniref:Glucosidase 2 subunit beta n=1 Tax=Clohesyomyces aquaticus TaxID=1231657 RepID=A0A1Y2A730_9PLEO|nr:glucosidase II beta subunit-like protein-domain-containing protein [Clohesyomyces aquaticus]